MTQYNKIYLIKKRSCDPFLGSREKIYEVKSLSDVKAYLHSSYDFAGNDYCKYSFIGTKFNEIKLPHKIHGNPLGFNPKDYEDVDFDDMEYDTWSIPYMSPCLIKDTAKDIKDVTPHCLEEEHLFDNGEDLF